MTSAGRQADPARLPGLGGRMSLRVLTALATSFLVTAAVAGPMAYQAHQARSEQERREPATQPESSVLGSTTERPSTTEPGSTGDAPDDEVADTTATTDTTAATSEPEPESPGVTADGGAQGPDTTAPGRRNGSTTVPLVVPPPATGGGAPGTSVPTATGSLPPPTARPSSTTATPPLSSDGLVAARTRAPGRAEPLDGLTVRGSVWVFLRLPAVERVAFWLDDPTGSGAPSNTEEHPPFSLVPGGSNGRPAPLDTTALADGTHSVLARVTFLDGRAELRLARFTVANR